MVWRGTYRSDVEYWIGDVVGVSGSAYVCVAATNQAPPVGFGWELLVSRGAQGIRGIKGEAGSGAAIDLPVSIANGGTGQTTAKNALDALLPSQTGKSGRFLQTNGVSPLWEVVLADASTLEGTTLKSTVVNSSLTSVGTLASLTVTNPISGSVTGNAATATTAATVTTAAQPTITSVGTLTAVNTSGVITGTNTTASTSSATGALIVAGGVGIAKDTFINGLRVGVGGTGTGISVTNAAFGVDALGLNTGTNCLGIGNAAGYNNTGGNVTAYGNAACQSNSGTQVVAIGGSTLANNTANNCVAIGHGAMLNNTGTESVGIGVWTVGTLGAGSSGTHNVGIGHQAGSVNTTGARGTFVGRNSGVANTTGVDNTFVGSTSGDICTTGTLNVCVGSNADLAASGNTNSIVIGASAVGLGSNTTVIGTSSTTSAKVWGAVTAAGTLTADAYILSSSGIQAKTASYTLVAADNGKVITMNVASANTLTVPASLAVGFNCTIIQIGAGATTITASGTTLNSVSAFLKISAQHGSASIISYASNVYNVAGSLSA
jgi:hypothetical protein